VFPYTGASRRNGPQRIYARHSWDAGLSWSARTRISSKHANAAFPAAIGGKPGDEWIQGGYKLAGSTADGP
jgi:hypothetical protein